MDSSRRTVREHRLLLIVTLGAGAGVVLLANATVSSKWLKLALLVCLLAAWAGLLLLGWRRKGWRYALLACGFRHGNGSAFRAFAEQWWYDASARALSEGYRGMTAATGARGTIRTMDAALLEPGDLAVTNDGVHVVVYAGGERWIQADPGAGKVETLPAKTGGSLYFHAPVTVFRWRLLQSP